MDREEHYRKLERLWTGAPINQGRETSLSISEGEATVTLKIIPDYFHAGGSLQSSLYLSVMDDAAYFAAASLVPDMVLATASFHLHLTRPVNEGTITAVARVVQRSQRLLLADVEMYDESGRVVSRGTGTYMHTGQRLSEIPGYK